MWKHVWSHVRLLRAATVVSVLYKSTTFLAIPLMVRYFLAVGCIKRNAPAVAAMLSDTMQVGLGFRVTELGSSSYPRSQSVYTIG